MNQPVTLITGASRGIGHATATRLARDGHLVIGLARKAPDAFPGEFFEADFADADATAQALNHITGRFEIDNLVNNAGRTTSMTVEQTSLEELQAIVDINLRAPLQCVQACLPAMTRKGAGRIVNVASRAALGVPRRTAYAATKSGLIGYTRTWALELGPRGITVNTVAPGPVLTELYQNNNPMSQDEAAKLVRRIPLQRLGAPEDIAGTIAFFLSPDASFVTGQVLYACGGLSVGAAPI